MISALAFLTVIGRGRTPEPAALPYFPIVGALVGGVVGAAWWGAGHLWPPLLAAAIAVVVDGAVTGLLHLDGVADCGDGLIAPMPRERRLAAMRDSAIGAFGAITLATTLLLRLAAFASIAATPRAVLVVAAIWAASRTAMATVALTVRYARADGGLASGFLGAGRARSLAVPLAVGAIVTVTLVVVARGAAGLAILAAVVGGAVAVTLFARRRLGGFTGDVLGAAGVIGETVGLVVWAALP